MKRVRALFVIGCLAAFNLTLTPALAQANVRITEFMAANENGLDDEDGDEEDWIEIHNTGTVSANLAGWFLTDSPSNLTRWMFPAVVLPPDGYLVVFASNKDRNVGELHTDFRLEDGGEYLALVMPDGVTVASEFSPAYPIQAPDYSYGLRGTTAQEVLLGPGAPARALVPADVSLEPTSPPGPDVQRPWTLEGLNDSGWLSGTTGVGYEADSGYQSLIGLNVISMRDLNETVYIRIPFSVADPSAISALTLRMRFDDGMIAYINGREVAWNNSPDPSQATWNSSAPANRPDGSATLPADFNITAFIDFLHVGSNLLAIQGLNNGIASSDLLVLPELIATVTGSGAETLRYFPVPTPGGPNNAGIVQLGPIVDQEQHRPELPADADAIRVSARVRPVLGAVTSVSLRYRVGFGAEVTLPMLDNGNNGDGGIGDGIYGAVIPASAAGPGAMVRWYATAADATGGSTRLPVFADPNNSPEYFGTVIDNPTLTNPLPVLHWFIQTPSAADNDAGTKCSLFYDGEFYDNLAINIHGQSSRGFPKKSYDIDFHPGGNFNWQDGEPRADDINLLTTYPDKAHMRNVLAYETYRDAGSGHHWVIPVRVQQNGTFWGTAHIVENGDEDWLIRMGLNSEGALYKMYNTFSSIGDATSGAEKKTRKNESNADLQALFNGISLTGEAQRRFLYDNLDVGSVINYLAARIITGDTDCCHKNYYFYRDTGVSDEWHMWAWDVDLSFGRRWIGSQTYWDEDLIPNTPLFIGNNNRLVQAVFGTPALRQMYLRRIRTMMDEMIKPTGTLPEALHYEPRIDALAAQLAPDAALDAARWNSHAWGNGSTAPCCAQSLPDAAAEIKEFYLPERRLQLFNGLTSGANELPGEQSAGTIVNIGDVDANPSGGNQDQEFVQLVNPNSFAVDISDWTLGGAVTFRFRGGTVLPANGTLYVAANRKAWRGRSVFPNGNQALYVTGDYDSRLSARGELLELTDRLGVTVASKNTPANPSLPQSFLRITEIMYHPPALPGDTFDSEEYEYLELKNIGASTLSLSGVRLADGVLFSFSSGSITALAAGAHVLVVKNLAAFTQRYGSTAAARVTGAFNGNLDNAGEEIDLLDQGNEKILEFSYNNAWHPITDGRGFSLVIVNPNADYRSWNLAESWRPSGREYGSPAADDTALPPVAGILINEVLSHSDLPDVDAIELFNPTAAPVDVSHWYLTDDPNAPKKYRIPPGTTLDAGGYAVFDESDFNPSPGVPPSFSFSSTGDEAYLYSGNAAGELTGYRHGYSFEAGATGISFGRHTDSLGREYFVPMTAVTLNGPNAAPRVGPVIISEINYHPPDAKEGVAFVDNMADEYVELLNLTAATVPLYDTNIPTNTWRLRGGVDFNFPQGVTLPANGRLLVVSFDPNSNPVDTAAFRARHGLSGAVALQGPFQGQLANEGEPVRLRRPDTPVPPPLPEAGLIPSLLVDEVDYSDRTPWPLAADGFGPSLQKINLVGFGNDPAHWDAANKTPGNAYPGGVAPSITVQPANQTIVAFSDTTLSVTASGNPPLQYQWLFDGDTLPGATNAALALTRVLPSQQGNYQAIVLNAAGSTVSSNAFLAVSIPASIVQHPRNTQAHLGASAIFVVQATSSSPLAYQWRKNSSPIPNATNSFLNISPVTLNDAGTYDVVVTDAVGSITSDPAVLSVLSNPVIVSQPVAVSVTVLGTPVNVAFTVAASSGTPLRYQWRFNGVPLGVTANIPSVTAATLNINGVGLNHAGVYTVVVTDDFGSVTSQPATLNVNTAAQLTLQPGPSSAPEGGFATFSASWTGSGPFLHRWRRTAPTSATLGFIGPATLGSLPVPGGYITASPTNTVLVFTNVNLAVVGAYDVVVSNAVGQLATADGVLSMLADTDQDGLPDSWETGRAGFSASNPADALRDDDGDGMTNAEEYLAGTDYADDQSYLRIDILPAGQAQLTFPAEANVTYTVQYTEALDPVLWRNLAIEPGVPGARVVTLVDPSSSPGRTYRLATPAQP